MRANPKPRGATGAVPELTKLKLLWRDALSESQREFWRSQFAGTSTQAQLRALLNQKQGINLARDNQLTEFRAWLEAQDAMDAEAERQGEEETRLRTEHPDWDAERLRSEVIASSLRRAMATGDFKGLGLKAVAASQKEKVIQLDRDKFELLQRRAAQADQAEQITKSAITEEEKAVRLRELFA